MHERPLLWVSDTLAENFMGDRGDIALAKNQKAEHMPDRVAFGPFEIYVRPSAGRITYVNQECGYCIGNSRTGSAQDIVSANTDAGNAQARFEL